VKSNCLSQYIERFFDHLPLDNVNAVVILRWPVLIGVAIKVFTTEPNLTIIFTLGLIGLSALFVYTLLNTFVALKHPPWSKNKRWSYFQVAFDIFIFSVLYFLTRTPGSDLFLFFFLPLLVAAENLDWTESAMTFGLIALILWYVILRLWQLNPTTTDPLVRIYLPRAIFFFFVLLFILIRTAAVGRQKQRAQRIEEIDERLRTQTDLKTLLQMITDESYKFFDASGVHLRLPTNGYLNKVAGTGPHLDIVRLDEDLIRYNIESPGHVKAFVSSEPYIRNISYDSFFKKLIRRSDGDARNFLVTLKCIGCFPLLVGGKPIGVLTIRSRYADYFTEELRNNAQYFALRAAVAIQNATLIEEREERAKRFKALGDSSLSIFKVEDYEACLEAIVQQSTSLLNATGGKIFLSSPDNASLELVAIHGLGAKAPPKGFKMPSDQGLVGKVIKTGKYEINYDYLNWPDAVDVFRSHIESVIEVPMKLEGETIGAIAVIANDEKRREGNKREFTEEDVAILELFAEKAATAIDKARLYQRAQRYRESLERIYDVNRVIASNFDLHDAFRRIAEQAYLIVNKGYGQPAAYSHITLVAGQVIDYAATYPPETLSRLKNSGLDLLDINIRKKEGKPIGIVGRVAETGQFRNEGNVENNADFIAVDIGLEINSQISVPIKVEDRVIGILSVLHPEHEYFTDEDRTRLEFLATHALVAIKTSRLLSARIGLTALTMPIMRQQHNIGRHISNIRRKIEDLLSNPDVEFQQDLVDIDSEASKIPIGDIKLPDSLATSRQATSISKIIQDTLKHNKLYMSLDERCRILEAPDDFLVSCNPDWLSYAIKMIIDNAIEAMGGIIPLDKRLLIIKTSASGKGVDIKITNNGSPITNEYLFKLFRVPFLKPSGSPDKKDRLSLGTFISAEIVENYNGYIGVESSNVDSTTIVIWLPCVKN
jgi:GAF domain-containing protein